METLNVRMKLLKKFLRTQDFVRAVYLFGSMATGKSSRHSDIDIAVLFDRKLTRQERNAKELFLISSLTSMLGREDLDVVVMNDAPLLLNFNIIRDGRILYCKSSREKIQNEVRIMSSYLDRDYYDSLFIKRDFGRIRKEGIL
ncbi:MAG: nucleotidyltransferase domain-containing protein [Candidatus Aenigmarchaeota archaeon]|nr:nucleotidyltransferase domain-containing protein [Candidatus Aenigmarchaeota archaeon]